ncbi:MAG: YcaO-like family protein [Sphingomonadaceae bacterium]|nr:YcaO-like family protein [Sphingomonadaceae bacterium]
MNPAHGLPADLPPAAHAYLAAFPRGEVVAFPITALDRTGVPVWIVALFLDPALGLQGAMPSGIGYGSTDADAVLGALGEIAEAIWPTLALKDRAPTLASYDELVDAHGQRAVADPLMLGLPAGSAVGRDTRLAWTEATRAATGETVLVPLDIAACDWFELPRGYQPFTTLITNGLGAGPDLDWAVGHGLLEILQRDGNGLRFRALDQGVGLKGASSTLLDRFAGQGITAIPKFATDEFGLMNLYVVGFDDHPPAPIALSACGEACHPDRQAALEKAAQEFAAARVRKAFSHGPQTLVDRVAPPGYTERFLSAARTSLVGGESRALSAMIDWSRRDAAELKRILAPVHAVRRSRPFADPPSPDLAGAPPSPAGEGGTGRLGGERDGMAPLPPRSARDRGAIARAAIEAAGFDLLYVDCSPPDRSIAVVKVIVPGLEVETMSYHRLGPRNARRLIDADSPLVRFGAPSALLKPVRMPPEDAERLGHPLFDTALADRIVGPLYPLYREPEAHHVAWVLGQAQGA